MEEQILKILNDNSVQDSPTGAERIIMDIEFETTAKEIESLIQSEYYEKEFVKWKDENVKTFYRWYTIYGVWEDITDKEERKFKELTLDEVHDYWLKEVKGK